jgi:hypothetical protein
MKNYIVQGCKEITTYEKTKGRITIETVINIVPCKDADFFGVYEAVINGTNEWVADFNNYGDAALFAVKKTEEAARNEM